MILENAYYHREKALSGVAWRHESGGEDKLQRYTRNLLWVMFIFIILIVVHIAKFIQLYTCDLFYIYYILIKRFKNKPWDLS